MVHTRAEALLLRYLGAGPPLNDVRLDDREWNEFADTAIAHRVPGILLDRIAHHGHRHHVPSEIRRRLREAAHRAKIFALSKRSGLEQFLRRAAAGGVSVVLLKGAFLAHRVYADFSHREMGDLDLLIKADQIHAAIAVLDSLGFEAERPFSIATDLAAHHHLTPFVRGGCVIELHWDLLQDATRCPDVWTAVEPVAIGTTPAMTLSAADMLIHVCVHAARQHGLSIGLRPLLDVAMLLADRSRSIDARALEARAREWDAQRAVALMMALATRMLGVATPAVGYHVEAPVIDAAVAQVMSAGTASTVVTENLARLQGVGWRDQVSAALQPLTRAAVARNYGVDADTASVHWLRIARAWHLMHRYAGPAYRAYLNPDSTIKSAQRRERLIRWMADS